MDFGAFILLLRIFALKTEQDKAKAPISFTGIVTVVFVKTSVRMNDTCHNAGGETLGQVAQRGG